MRPGGGDGRKGNVLQRAGLAPERLQRLRRGDLGQPALRRLASNQARKRASAAPSRTCAARAPASSTLFLPAFISVIGSAPTIRLAARRLAAPASGAPARSPRRTRRARLPRRARRRIGNEAIRLLDLGERRRDARARRCDSFRAVDNRASAARRCGTIGEASGSGVCATSAPRMLNSQATLCASLTTSPSARLQRRANAARSWPTRSRRRSRSGCAVTAPSGAAADRSRSRRSDWSRPRPVRRRRARQALANRSTASGVCSHGS